MFQCVNKNEVGKVYSVLGITGSLVPIAGNPAFRQLYRQTLSFFPRSVLILSGAVGVLCMFCNIYLFTQKGKMKLKGKEGTQEGDAESIEDEGFSEEE